MLHPLPDQDQDDNKAILRDLKGDEPATPMREVLTTEQYVGIKQGVGLIRPIPWPPCPEQYVGIRSLSLQETERTYLAATEHARQSKRPDSDLEFRSISIKRIRLWHALRKVVWLEQKDGSLKQIENKPAEHLFTSPDHFRESITEMQFDKLLVYYDEHERLTVPLTRAQRLAEDQQLADLARSLKKKPESIELNELLLSDVLGLISYLLAKVDLPDPET